LGGLAWLERRHSVEQLRGVRHFLPSHFHHHVTRTNAAECRWSVVQHAGDEHPLFQRQIKGLGDLGRQVAWLNTDPTASDLSVTNQAFHDLASRGDRDCKANAHAAARA